MSQLRLVEAHKKGKRLENKVYDIPAAQDQEIAGVKLTTMGYKIDKLTKRTSEVQRRLFSWNVIPSLTFRRFHPHKRRRPPEGFSILTSRKR